jgi:hypothetical protein
MIERCKWEAALSRVFTYFSVHVFTAHIQVPTADDHMSSLVFFQNAAKNIIKTNERASRCIAVTALLLVTGCVTASESAVQARSLLLVFDFWTGLNLCKGYNKKHLVLEWF